MQTVELNVSKEFSPTQRKVKQLFKLYYIHKLYYINKYIIITTWDRHISHVFIQLSSSNLLQRTKLIPGSTQDKTPTYTRYHKIRSVSQLK